MINHEIQEAIIHPTRSEIIMAFALMAVLILHMAINIKVATYEPACVPAIVTTEETE
jgi:hypothetical protein